MARPGQQHRLTLRGNGLGWGLGGGITEREYGWNGWNEAKGKPLPDPIAYYIRSLVFRALPTEFSSLFIIQ